MLAVLNSNHLQINVYLVGLDETESWSFLPTTNISFQLFKNSTDPVDVQHTHHD